MKEAVHNVTQWQFDALKIAMRGEPGCEALEALAAARILCTDLNLTNAVHCEHKIVVQYVDGPRPDTDDPCGWLMHKCLADKEARRKAIAALPVADKCRILERLRDRAAEIRRAK